MIIFLSIVQVSYSRYALQTDKVSWYVKVRTPPLNPIELDWSILDKKLMTTPICNKATVRKRLEDEWKGLGIELRRSLVDSIPERLGKFLRAKVKHFI